MRREAWQRGTRCDTNANISQGERSRAACWIRERERERERDE